MNKLTRISATVASSLALVAGFSGMAGAATIDTTGFGSSNQIRHHNTVRTDVHTSNKVHATVNNPQTAVSGSAWQDENTSGGDVETGMAHNDSFVEASLNVDGGNGASDTTMMSSDDGMGWDGASIGLTGAESDNMISSRNSVRTTVNTHNDVSFTSNNSQTAVSGNASSNRNTTGGSVMTGDATNISTVMVDLDLSN